MIRYGMTALILSLGVMTLGPFGATLDRPSTQFELISTNNACLPDATGRVSVVFEEERRGVDALFLRVSHLPANTEFSVFLTEASAFDAPPFGATDYIGELRTNAAGAATLRVEATVAEAFVSTRQGNPVVRVRNDLDQVVLWFADPAQVPACFNFQGSTPFDGDGAGGPAALSSMGATGLELMP